MVSADCLILLSNIDGMYTAPPSLNANAKHLPEISEITDEMANMAGDAGKYGTGGMVTKLEAARISIQSGCHMAIIDGRPDLPISALEQGAKSTWFIAGTSPRAARKRWIAGILKPNGRILIDDGAHKALVAEKSLLPAGITDVIGQFQRGDAVIICDQNSRELARGLTAYGDGDARKIAGRKSREIEAILGYHGRTSLVHRDDLVLTCR
jgi:glutamate 5-kinase